MNPDVSIIIATWNGRQHLDACLSAVAAQRGVDAETLLVDNASTDDTVAFVRNRFPWVRLVRLEENRGFAGGNNAGVREARGRYIAFLNNEHNRSLIRGVIAAGNNNFGAEFAYAGDVVSRKCGVPYLYRFELMGTPDDVEAVRVGLEVFWKDQTCHQPSQLQSL